MVIMIAGYGSTVLGRLLIMSREDRMAILFTPITQECTSMMDLLRPDPATKEKDPISNEF